MAKQAKPLKRMHVHIGRGGRVVLPAEVRRALGVQTGDEMVLTLEPEGTPGSVRLETVPAAIRRAQQIVSEQATIGKTAASDELMAERRAAADDE